MGVASSATSESILCAQFATRVPLRAPNCVPKTHAAARTAASVQGEYLVNIVQVGYEYRSEFWPDA